MFEDSSLVLCVNKSVNDLSQEERMSKLIWMRHRMQQHRRGNDGYYRMKGSVAVMGDLFDSPVSLRVPRSTCANILQRPLELLTFGIQYPRPLSILLTVGYLLGQIFA